MPSKGCNARAPSTLTTPSLHIYFPPRIPVPKSPIRSKRIAVRLRITDLPQEMLLYIFSFLTDAKEMCTVSQVCKEWYTISKDRTLWDQITLRSKASLEGILIFH